MTDLSALDDIAYDWGVRCFGEEHMNDTKMRALRFLEEAVELCQALGLDRPTLHTLIHEVYARPAGDLKQEIGGTILTLRILIRALRNWTADGPPPLFDGSPDMQAPTLEALYLREVRRCLSKTTEHFSRRNLEKINLGLKP